MLKGNLKLSSKVSNPYVIFQNQNCCENSELEDKQLSVFEFSVIH